MKICALTMAYKDHWALSQWFRHYSRLLGPENLYVVSHGADPRIQEICPGASVLTIPRDRLQGFDHWRGRMLNGFQQGLLEIYDWVIRSDADELICLDPARWGSLADMLADQQAPAVFALGFNLFDFSQSGVNATDLSVFAKTRDAVFTGHYSKAWAVRRPIGLRRHGIQLRPARLAQFPFAMPRGVYLAHLKYADVAALSAMSEVRQEVGNSEGPGTPGKAWKQAAKEAVEKREEAEALPQLPWDEAEETAWNSLQSPVRDEASSVLRCKSLRFQFRTTLPSWFSR
ncbi:glycosyltransferase family 2 protein [Pseudophaeobacter sp. TrK17]|uniref:glycosyltransferase family 2 protein n=1 Tax=Pseudophaeobacter sp. TrK17 TaxID=2815167 RepID=UPI0035CF0CA5